MEFEDTTCEECGAPASVAWGAPGSQTGVDFDGAPALFTVGRVNCAAGHWYTAVELFVSVPLTEEE